VHIGHYPGAFGGVEYFAGGIDDVRLYSRGLSAAEVLDLFNSVDTTPPVISAVAAASITTSGATISWMTNEASDSQVDYGLTTAYGGTSPPNASLVTAHTVSLSGLTDSTPYHYRVRSRDAAGNLGLSGDVTFSTLDGTPPSVSMTAPASGATVSSAVSVTANATDNVGVVGVQFRLDGAMLGAEVLTGPYAIAWDPATTTNGVHALTAVARDAAGNRTTSASSSVTVNVDYSPPILSAVAASAITASGATISWTSNESATSQADYGPAVAYGSSTLLDVALLTSHSQLVSGLSASTGYHYRVKSRDATGNLGTSADFTFTTSAPPLPAGVIAYWPLDDGSGTVALDATGNGNTGTLVNGPTWTTGAVAGALAFNGINQSVSVAHTAALDAFPLSVSAWIKTTSTTGVSGIVNKYVANSNNGYNLFLNNGAICAWYSRSGTNYVYDGGGCTLQTAGYNNGLWHQVVYVVDTAGARLYVDGAQVGTLGWTGPAGPPTTTQPVHIGHYPGAFGGVEYFAGGIDDVRIYNRALSGTEVSALYSGVTP
jgi:hypothetical protein